MGSPFHLIFYCKDSIEANRAATSSFLLVDSLINIFSDYIPESELNRLVATAGVDSFVSVSNSLFEIFLIADEAWRASKGRFDITAGPLSKVWRNARREKIFPHSDTLSKAKQKVGWNQAIIDKEYQRIKFLVKNIQLDLGGIAAGYIAQKVADFLKTIGITSALVDASGDIVCTNPPPGKNGWIIGINEPGEENRLLDKTLEVNNCSVSTSGDVYQYMEHKGKRYSHIIDPKTGYGSNFQRNVTIIANDGATADWLATAFSLLPMKNIRCLSKKMKAEYLITQRNKSKIRECSSQGLNKYWQKNN
jgi:FAD:protein FMN transferase